jgi:hypothetical protein
VRPSAPVEPDQQAKVSFQRPVFPKALAERGVEGIVDLVLVIGSEGKVLCIAVDRSAGPELDELSVTTLSGPASTWQPGTLDGVPVDSFFTYRMRWELADDT